MTLKLWERGNPLVTRLTSKAGGHQGTLNKTTETVGEICVGAEKQ